jgi:hypothetical protein
LDPWKVLSVFRERDELERVIQERFVGLGILLHESLLMRLDDRIWIRQIRRNLIIGRIDAVVVVAASTDRGKKKTEEERRKGAKGGSFHNQPSINA